MSGKINNKTLLVVFLALTGIMIITKLITSKKSVRTFETELVKIDTSKITSMSFYPSSNQEGEIQFTKKGNKWMVSSNGILAVADKDAIHHSLGTLLNLKTQRLVARSKEKWSEYQVVDSLGTRIVIHEGKKNTLDLMIGKFDYKPPPQRMQGYPGYGQNQISGSSYIRSYSESEVYAVEGFLGLNFNQNFNAWRYQTLSRISPAQITKMVFDFPADSGFIAQKSGSGWIVGGLPADSASMAQFLQTISHTRNSNFEDGFQPSVAPDYQLSIEGDNMVPLLIRAYSDPGGDYILHSSFNPESWFRSTKDDLFARFFKPVENFNYKD